MNTLDFIIWELSARNSNAVCCGGSRHSLCFEWKGWRKEKKKFKFFDGELFLKAANRTADPL